MTIRHQIEVEGITFVLIAAFFSAFLVFKNNQNFQKKFFVASPIIAGNAAGLTPQTIVSPSPTVERQSQISPDGAKNVIMQITTNNNDTKTYAFFMQNTSDNSQKLIFTNTLPTSSSMSLPFNTFSPDNKYFFIQQNTSDGGKVFAFLTSGDSFANGQLYDDITNIFSKKITQYTFDRATGWASETLIIVNTKNQDGSKGPSFWVELPSTAVIQLASQF